MPHMGHCLCAGIGKMNGEWWLNIDGIHGYPDEGEYIFINFIYYND